MALIYPTETYITVDDARSYADTMGLSLPPVGTEEDETDDSAIELLLKRAAIYLDRLYGARYIGNRTAVPASKLYWPRTVVNYYDSLGNWRDDLTYTSVPAELGMAQVELASMMFSDDYDPFAPPEPSLKKETSKLEGLELTLEYADVGGYVENDLNKIDLILAPLLKVYSKNSGRITSTRGG